VHKAAVVAVAPNGDDPQDHRCISVRMFYDQKRTRHTNPISRSLCCPSSGWLAGCDCGGDWMVPLQCECVDVVWYIQYSRYSRQLESVSTLEDTMVAGC
jgi:hypothetical protein